MAVATTAVTALSACRGVSVTHGSGASTVHALTDVDFELRAGETVSLQGPSGSGKTTVLHLLGGLLVPSAGQVLWKGAPLSSLDAAARGRARAGGIAYVLQGSNLLPSFNAYENVAFAAWVSSRADRERWHEPAELLELVGLAKKARALPAELSGGEAQRVALARALAQSPELLLCDEPTGHLDSDTASRVLELLDALQRRFGFAMAIATHDRGVASHCDRRIVLRDGRIAGERS
jgi:putative ABC transport system ATP-binding protein